MPLTEGDPGAVLSLPVPGAGLGRPSGVAYWVGTASRIAFAAPVGS